MKKEVRDGYKMTELGEIPNEWEIIKLNECGYIFGGNAFKSSSFTTEYKENDYQVIRMGNVQLGKLDLEKNPVFLSENLVGEKEKKYLLKEADILISLTGTVNKTDYGNISWADKNNKYLLNQRVGCLRNDNGEFNNRYYYYLLQSNMFRNQFFECGVGGTGNQANVSIADLNNIKVLKLPTREQEKIASILSTVDEQIDNVDALIEKNKELKKGLMQTLLTKGIGHTKLKKTEIGEIPEEWEVKKLEDVCEILDSKRIPLNEKQRLTMKGDIPYYGANSIVDYINNYLFDSTLILLAEDGGNFFEFKEKPIAFYVEGKCWVNNHAHVLEAKIAESSKWIFYNLVHRDLSNIVQGGTRAKLNQKDLRNIIVTFPKLEEQQKIASILSEVDNKIEEYENKKERLEELKKGLMQQLLSGKIRVIAD